MPSSYAQKDLPKLIALVALYVLAARLTLLLFGNNGVVEFLWAASGISLAVVLLGGNKYLPAVFLGSLPGYLLIGEPPGFSVAVALCHAASIFLGTWVMKREGGLNPALLKPGDFFRIFRLFAVADIGQGNAYRRAGTGRGDTARHDILLSVIQLCLKHRAVAAQQGQFQATFLPAAFCPQEMLHPATLVFGNDQRGEGLLLESFTVSAQQRDGREVDLLDRAVVSKREITDRGEVVEIDIAVARGFKLYLGSAQGLVLYFQLDLMHLKLMQQVFGREACGRQRVVDLPLRQCPQGHSLMLPFRVRLHGRSLASGATIAARAHFDPKPDSRPGSTANGACVFSRDQLS